MCSAKSEHPSKSAFPDRTVTKTLRISPKKTRTTRKVTNEEQNKRQLHITLHEEQKKEKQKQEEQEKKI